MDIVPRNKIHQIRDQETSVDIVLTNKISLIHLIPTLVIFLQSSYSRESETLWLH